MDTTNLDALPSTSELSNGDAKKKVGSEKADGSKVELVNNSVPPSVFGSQRIGMSSYPDAKHDCQVTGPKYVDGTSVVACINPSAYWFPDIDRSVLRSIC